MGLDCTTPACAWADYQALPLGRGHGCLFGVVPFDCDRLLITEMDFGRRFLERYTVLSMRLWVHERTVTEVAVAARCASA